jgi:hypothetical protein
MKNWLDIYYKAIIEAKTPDDLRDIWFSIAQNNEVDELDLQHLKEQLMEKYNKVK